MRNELQGIFDYLSTIATDTFPRYILKKEILISIMTEERAICFVALI